MLGSESAESGVLSSRFYSQAWYKREKALYGSLVSKWCMPVLGSPDLRVFQKLVSAAEFRDRDKKMRISTIYGSLRG
jgi:hypothetical protein